MTFCTVHILLYFLLLQLVNCLLPVPLFFACGIIGIETYCRLPLKLVYGSSPASIKELEQVSNKKRYKDGTVIIIPGAGGPDENTQQLEETIRNSDKKKRLNRLILTYDWSQWKGSLIRASFNSQAIGRFLALQLSGSSAVDSNNYHIIGISVGSFAADNVARTLREIENKKNKDTGTDSNAYIRLTFLDPFTLRGLFGVGYGLNRFGKECSYAEQFLNTDDPVPSTNTPLVHSICYDVTDSVEKKDYTPLPNDVPGHSWPVVYYSKNYQKLALTNPLHSSSCPRGAVIKVK